MFNFIITLIIIVSVLLVFVILAQKSKGGGLSSQFGGGSASQIIGAQKSGDVLEKITWGFAVALVILTLSTKLFLGNNNASNSITSPVLEDAEKEIVAPPTIGQEPETASDSTKQAE
ncbi:MAG: preprotein translocase subunit SecG [Cytophagales bacterium]|nr:preprotein translocase subunit SecG [Cytophagales bacterium]